MVTESFAADVWNATVPIGTPVRYWPTADAPEVRVSRTHSEAWTLGDGTAVVKIEGMTGGVALTHVSTVMQDVGSDHPTLGEDAG